MVTYEKPTPHSRWLLFVLCVCVTQSACDEFELEPIYKFHQHLSFCSISLYSLCVPTVGEWTSVFLEERPAVGHININRNWRH